MTTDSVRIVADSPGRTAEVAAAVAGQLQVGDVVLLHGGLAAGKTTFVTAVAAALGSPDQVTSPTFMLAQFYSGGRVPVLHLDTYRLTGVAEFRDLEGAFKRRTITERAKGILMERHSVDEERAFQMLRDHARRTQSMLVDAAQSIIDGTLSTQEL